MAAGKTSLARALAKRLDWQAVDIDELIEQRERATVAEIFAKQGEAHFRAVERSVLFEQLASRHRDRSRERPHVVILALLDTLTEFHQGQ